MKVADIFGECKTRKFLSNSLWCVFSMKYEGGVDGRGQELPVWRKLEGRPEIIILRREKHA